MIQPENPSDIYQCKLFCYTGSIHLLRRTRAHSTLRESIGYSFSIEFPFGPFGKKQKDGLSGSMVVMGTVTEIWFYSCSSPAKFKSAILQPISVSSPMHPFVQFTNFVRASDVRKATTWWFSSNGVNANWSLLYAGIKAPVIRTWYSLMFHWFSARSSPLLYSRTFWIDGGECTTFTDSLTLSTNRIR